MPRTSTATMTGSPVKVANWIIALALLTSSAATAATRVIDGDTIDLNGMPIRILKIDTPETFRSRCDNEHALGLKAKERLIELLDGAEVTYRATGYDRWGRVLAYVYADEIDVGQELLDEGLALPYLPGPKDKARRLAVWCPTK